MTKTSARGHDKPRKPATPAVVYPPGFFTAPARAWGVVAPSMDDGVPAEVVEQRRLEANSKRSRSAALATGNGWGNGTIVMGNTPKHPKPLWMPRAPERKLGRPAKVRGY